MRSRARPASSWINCNWFCNWFDAEAIAAVTGQEVPDTGEDSAIEVDAAATDHMLTVEAGWEFVVKEKLVIDLTLGGAFSVGASSKLSRAGDATSVGRERPGAGAAGDPLDPLLRAGEEYLDNTLTSYVHTPTVGVMVGYRFR